MPPRGDLSKAEFAVLKILWELGRGTVAEVRAAYRVEQGTDLAYTTILTLLTRMAAKGALRVERSEEPFVYRPASSKARVIRQKLKQFVDTVFDGRPGELVLRLVEDETLSKRDLARIEDVIAEGVRKKR